MHQNSNKNIISSVTYKSNFRPEWRNISKHLSFTERVSTAGTVTLVAYNVKQKKLSKINKDILEIHV